MAKESWLLVFMGLVVSCSSAGLLGGWTQQNDLNNVDESTQKVFNYVTQDIKNTSENHVAVTVESVKTQVVSGVNYRITVNVKQTDCPKQETYIKSDCPYVREKRCKYQVYDIPWQNFRKISKSSCNDWASLSDSKKKNLPGGHNNIEKGDKSFREALDFFIEDFNARSNHMYRKMPFGENAIKSATKQVIRGLLYKFTIQMGVSDCRNSDEHRHAQYADCPVNVGKESETCQVSISYQAWETPQYKLISHDCSGNQHHLLGQDGHDLLTYTSFETFVKKYNKPYHSDKAEMKNRFKVYMANMQVARSLQLNETGTAIYGPTEFADLTPDEFRKWYLTPRWDVSYNPLLTPAEIPQGAAPAAFDWRNHSAVTPVKNQGQCGSCWAFSTTGNIEGQWAIAKGKLVSLSEQELVDCDKIDQGCDGGLPSNAYQEIRRLGGLETETAYPYEAEDDKCEFKFKDVKVYINGSLNISSNEADMANWLAKNGPISIGINAAAMQFYFGGVSHPFSFFCDPDSLDHGVLIVGYGTAKGWFSDNPYWIVKNSWGTSWGEAGYYRVYRGAGVCGLNKMPTSALVK